MEFEFEEYRIDFEEISRLYKFECSWKGRFSWYFLVHLYQLKWDCEIFVFHGCDFNEKRLDETLWSLSKSPKNRKNPPYRVFVRSHSFQNIQKLIDEALQRRVAHSNS